jgi:hypothetical protein
LSFKTGIFEKEKSRPVSVSRIEDLQSALQRLRTNGENIAYVRYRRSPS